jgi:hypothetical protein
MLSEAMKQVSNKHKKRAAVATLFPQSMKFFIL